MGTQKLTFSSNIINILTNHLQNRAEAAKWQQYINQKVDNVIDDVDPRLHAIMGCKKIIAPCVEKVLNYADDICSRLPGPLEFSRESHRINPTVRSVFANHRKMAEVLSYCPAVQTFFNEHPEAENAYLILGMKMNKKTAYGMEQKGDMIVRDVLKTNVNFDDYMISHPSVDEASLRFNLRERALHECVSQTIRQLMNSQTCNDQLEEKEIKLKMQLSMLKNQQKGLGPLMQGENPELARISHIKAELKKIEDRQEKISKDMGSLNGLLKTTASLLIHPSKLIDVTSISFCLDVFNQMLDDCSENDPNRVNLAQISFSDTEKRVGLLGVFPRDELITEKPKPVYL